MKKNHATILRIAAKYGFPLDIRKMTILEFIETQAQDVSSKFHPRALLALADLKEGGIL